MTIHEIAARIARAIEAIEDADYELAIEILVQIADEIHRDLS